MKIPRNILIPLLVLGIQAAMLTGLSLIYFVLVPR
jgi:hypothetical protein